MLEGSYCKQRLKTDELGQPRSILQVLRPSADSFFIEYRGRPRF